jgi:hypothetical protein
MAGLSFPAIVSASFEPRQKDSYGALTMPSMSFLTKVISCGDSVVASCAISSPLVFTCVSMRKSEGDVQSVCYILTKPTTCVPFVSSTVLLISRPTICTAFAIFEKKSSYSLALNVTLSQRRAVNQSVNDLCFKDLLEQPVTAALCKALA